ncbi:HD domain-containing protein [Candidatus Nomurabacteria bacterium]|nr:HD domain-containing protein [Candidatus Nomurabacteria bacterium]
MFSKKVFLAIKKATKWHKGQTRKDGDLPYIVHPYSVAMILSKYTENEDVVIAGLLHDVLEDVDPGLQEQIKEMFGEKVLQYVKEVSEVKEVNGEEVSWEERKRMYNEGLRSDSQEALMISTADHINNWQDILNEYEEIGDKAFAGFLRPIGTRIENFKEVHSIIMERLDNPIKEELDSTMKKVLEVIKY